MGIIARFSGAPYKDGDVLDAGTEAAPDGLELDVSRLFHEFNGGIDDNNISDSADISGSKIAPASIPAGKVADLTVQTNLLEDNTIPTAKFQDDAIELDNIVANAVSDVEEATGVGGAASGSYPGTGSVSQSILTGKYPTLVLISWHFYVSGYWHLDADIQCRIRRGSTYTVFESSAAVFANGLGNAQVIDAPMVSFVYMDANAPAESMVSYDCAVKIPAGYSDINTADHQLTLVNLRR